MKIDIIRTHAWLSLTVVLMLAALLRVWNIGEQSIWFDEWNGLSGMHEPTFAAAQKAQILNDDMVPLYFALQYFWLKIVHYDLGLARLVPMVFGIASVALVYLLGWKLHSPHVGCMASFLMAISPYNIQFSHELRPYSLMLFFSLLSMYAISSLLTDIRPRWWLLGLLSNIALVWTHLFGIWLILVQGLVILLFGRGQVKRLAFWTTAHIVLFIPVVLHILTWEQVGMPPLSKDPVYLFMALFAMDAAHLAFMPRIGLLGTPPVYAVADSAGVSALEHAVLPSACVLTLAVAGFLTAFAVRLRSYPSQSAPNSPVIRPHCWMLLLWYLGPPLLLYLFSILVIPAFQVRYVLCSLPALYLIVSIVTFNGRFLSRVGTLVFFILPLTALGLLAVNIPLRPDHLGATAYIRANRLPNDHLILHPFNSAAAFGVALQDDSLPKTPLKQIGEALLAFDQDVGRDGHGWFVLMPWVCEFATERSRLIEEYLELRQIQWERKVFAGWWDIFVYRGVRGNGYLPLSVEEARRTLRDAGKDTARHCVFGWIAAKMAEDAGALREAISGYSNILAILPEDRDARMAFERHLEITGWNSEYYFYGLSLIDDLRSQLSQRIASCKEKVAARDTSWFYRLDDHLNDAVSRTNTAAHSPQSAVLELWPSNRSWTTGAPESKISIENDVLTFASAGRDGITTPEGLEIYGPAVDAIAIDMEVSGTDHVFLSWRPADTFWDWCDMDENLLIPIRVVPDVRNAYVVRVAEMHGWQHRRIEGMRLVTKEAAQIRLHGFRLLLRAGLFNNANGVRPFRIGNETRNCLYMRTNGELIYEIPLPERGVFSTGLAIVEDGLPVDFEVQAQSGAQVKHQSWRIEERGHWYERTVDLAEFSGRSVKLHLSAKAGDGQVALWSNPRVASAKAPQSAPPAIVCYVVDSLRADHLSFYGYDRNTSPKLEQFAWQGFIFDRFFTNETCTKPSMTTFHTGVDAGVHGISCTTANDAGHLIQLPEVLRQYGYETIAVTENLYTPPDSNGRAAYSHVFDLDEITSARTGETFETISGILEQVWNRPFFLYVHTMECHVRIDKAIAMTYEAPPPFNGTFSCGSDTRVDGYDDAIFFADSNFGRVLDKLDAVGISDRTLVIFTSDHGEGFGAHGGRVVHGYEPYSELVHVPLVVRLPAQHDGGRRISRNAQFSDLASTLLDYAGLPACPQFSGVSLRDLIERESSFVERPIFGYTGESLDPESTRSLLLGDWKLLGPPGQLQLFNIAEDPNETIDVQFQNQRTFQGLKSLFDAHTEQLRETAKNLHQGPQTAVVKVFPETEERLRALGYVGD